MREKTTKSTANDATKKVKTQEFRAKALGVIAVSLVMAGVSACSSGSSGGGGSGGSANAASGPVSVKAPTCAGSACLGAASTLSVQTSANHSKTVLLEYASEIYNNFRTEVVPGVNKVLYGFEQAAASEGFTTCADLAGATNTSNYSLGSGYTVDVANGDKTIPTGMTDASTTTAKKFVISSSGTAFAEVQLYCSGTRKVNYVRATSSSQTFEFWSESDSSNNKQVLFGAFDSGSSKYTIYFSTADGAMFQLHAVGNNFSDGANRYDFAIAGAANLTAGTADLAVSGAQEVSSATPNNSQVVPTSLSHGANNATWAFEDIRHCYSDLSAETLDAAGTSCGDLDSGAGTFSLSAPPTLPLRSTLGTGAWSVNYTANSAIPTTF